MIDGGTGGEMPETARLVLDTSAVLALRSDEPGAERVERLLRAARAGRATVLLSFMTRMELLYRIAKEEGRDEADSTIRLLDAAGVEWVSCEPAILEEAARIKAGGGLSVADAWIAATAAVRDALLVHKDPEFDRARGVRQERLHR
jgi:predicted nucleic acid-binding protein